MEIKVEAEKLSVEMAYQVAMAEVAVTKGIRRTVTKIQTSWRNEVGARLSARLAQAIRVQHYPQRASTDPSPPVRGKGPPPKTHEASLNAASMVYARPGKTPETGAARILAGHEEGSLIRASGRTWLAIPTEEADRARGSKSATSPAEWERRTGIKLNVVVRPNGHRLLVANVRLGRARKDGKLPRLVRSRMTKKGAFGSSTFTSVIFFLVPQVRLSKRLSLMQTADRLIQGLPDAIVKNWPG